MKKTRAKRQYVRRGESSQARTDPPLFVTPEAEEVYTNHMVKRGVITERGFEPTPAGHQNFVRVITERGWEALMKQPGPYSLPLVREFYANMISTRKSSVRGKEVDFTSRAVNEYFGLAAPAQCQFLDYCSHPDNNHVLQVLTAGRGVWRRDSQGKPLSIDYAHLEPEIKVWYHVVASKFYPILHLTELPYDRALLIYAITANLQINVGVMISGLIQYAVNKHNIGLPFPSMITDLIRRAGVEIPEASLLPCRPSLGDRSIRRIMRYVPAQQHHPEQVQVPEGPVPFHEPPEEVQAPPPAPEPSSHTGDEQAIMLANIWRQLQLNDERMQQLTTKLDTFAVHHQTVAEHLAVRLNAVGRQSGLDLSTFPSIPRLPHIFQSQGGESSTPPSSHQPHDQREDDAE